MDKRPSDLRIEGLASATVAAGIAMQEAVMPEGECSGFDPEWLERPNWNARAFNWVTSYPVHRVLAFLGLLTPVLPMVVWRAQLFLRNGDVRQVLSRSDLFPVPWHWKMIEVTGGHEHGGRNFVLGMKPGDEYRLSYEQIARVFPLSDVKHVGKLSAKAASNIVKSLANGQPFDAIEDLITAVPTRMCAQYYGLKIATPDANNAQPSPAEVMFAKWTLVVSSYLFAPPFTRQDDEGTRQAQAAAHCLRRVIRDSIETARTDPPPTDTAMAQFLKLQAADPDHVTDDVIHAQLFGKVLGFIPTNVLAGGNILETLLKRPDFMARARNAALADDDRLLWQCLREALRFRNINLGPFREVGPQGYTVRRRFLPDCRLKPGTPVLASTQAAMFDPRVVKRPGAFDPDRPDDDYLVFGVGQHWCVGAYIAIAQLTQTFKPLLRREALEPVEGKRGKLQRFGAYPLHLQARFGEAK
ncbi:cytochrome P450 [Piscinibacter sakaiensis]|uniref:cytochrome P450 n=1 Tax=Piscinibacter sakaiensis TaxID=1547922 RepID=UPI003AAC84E4